MITSSFTVFASPDIRTPPSPNPGIEPIGEPCDLAPVDAAWIRPSPWYDTIHRPSETQLIDTIEFGEPLTLVELSHALHVPLAAIEQMLKACEAGELYRRSKRWIDQSRFGKGCEFVGLVGCTGIPEPTGLESVGDELPEIDPRTVLSCIRSARAVDLDRLARRLLVRVETLTIVVKALIHAGHVKASKRGKRIWLYPIVHECQKPTRKPSIKW